MADEPLLAQELQDAGDFVERRELGGLGGFGNFTELDHVPTPFGLGCHQSDGVARLVAAESDLKRSCLGESPSRRVDAPWTPCIACHETCARALCMRASIRAYIQTTPAL